MSTGGRNGSPKRPRRPPSRPRCASGLTLAILAALLATDIAWTQEAPSIRIDAPRDLDRYQGDVTVQGQVRDNESGRDTTQTLAGVTWSVLGTGQGGEIRYDSQGRFRFSFPAPADRAGLFIKLRARNTGGAEGTDSVAVLRQPDRISLAVDSPEAGAPYTAGTLEVSGRVEGEVDRIERLEWHLDGSSRQGVVPFGPDGGFEFPIPTDDLSGPLSLRITATLRGGWFAETSVPVIDASSVPPPVPALAEAVAPPARPVAPLDAAPPLPPLAGLPLPAEAVAAEEPEAPVSITVASTTGAAVLELASPAEGAPYGAYVSIRGRVQVEGKNPEPGTGALSVDIGPTIIRPESVPFHAQPELRVDGGFEVIAPTSLFRGDQKVTVTFTRDKESVKATVTMPVGGAAVAGLQVRGEDRAVVATWPPVPLATRYDVALATGERVDRYNGVRSPFRAGGLRNGDLYTLHVEAVLTTGETLASEALDVIPLNPDMLRPEVLGEYRRIRLSWPAIKGARAYEVWRSLEGSDQAVKVTQTSERGYVDSDVGYGRVYTYSIAALPGGLRGAAASASTIAYPTQRFTLESSLGLDGGVRALTVDRNYAYLARGEAGLAIVEVSDAAHPKTVAEVSLPDARDVKIATLSDGHRYAVVADGERGLVAIDVSVPGAPTVEGSRVTTDARRLVMVSSRDQRLAYVADGESGVKVIDLAAPRRPERIASLQTGDAQALYLKLPYLYVAGETGLTVLELGDPASPSIVSQTRFPGALDLAGDSRGGGLYLYVATGKDGLVVLDASDPRAPRLVGSYTMTDARAVAVSRYVYLADGRGGVEVLDMTDPARPVLFDKIEGPTRADLDLDERSDERLYLYTVGPAGMDTYQVLLDGRSLEMGSFAVGERGYTLALTRLGTPDVWAVLAAHGRGVHVLRLDGLGTPEFTGSGSRVSTVYAYDAAVVQIPDRGWYLAVADAEGGLKVFDLAKPGDIGAQATRPVGSGFARNARAVTPLGAGSPIVLVADGREGLRVFDLSRPEAVRQIALVASPGIADVAVARPAGSGPLALASGTGGLTVVDLSTPSAPVVRGRLAMRGSGASAGARKVAVVDDEVPVFAAITDTEVLLVSAANPDTPRAVGGYPTEYGEDLYAAVDTRRLYVAEGHLGLTILDVSDPTRPRRVSSFPDVYVAGVTGWVDDPDHVYAYALDTTRVWQVQVLVPAWLRR